MDGFCFGAHKMQIFEDWKPGKNLDCKKCLQLIDSMNFRAELEGKYEWEEEILLSLAEFG